MERNWEKGKEWEKGERKLKKEGKGKDGYMCKGRKRKIQIVDIRERESKDRKGSREEKDRKGRKK